MRRYGLIGYPLTHSFSPVLHKLLYQELGVAAEYTCYPLSPQRLENSLQALRESGISGVNVTMPHKQAVLPFLDVLSEEAARIGAVNTLLFRSDGSICGFNTDCFGFLAQLKRDGISIPGRKFVLCGTGGAAKAVRWALEDHGAAEVCLASRTLQNERLSYESLRQLRGFDGIVNCTPVGMYPDTGASVVDRQTLERFQYAVDLVYNPSETEFLRLAKEAGLRASSGLYMLVAQGVRSYELWTGQTVSNSIVERIFYKMNAELLSKPSIDK